jgi:hypothetical protein
MGGLLLAHRIVRANCLSFPAGYDPPVLPSDPQGRSPYYFDIAQDSRDVLYGPFQDNLDWENVNVDLFIAATLEIANAHAAHILPDSDGTVHIAWQFGTE